MRGWVARGTAALVVVLALGGCGDGGNDDDAASTAGRDTVAVVAGFYPLAEAAERVGGERVDVTNLTPAGAEPHDLELNPGQVDQILDADVVLYLGQGFQPALEEVAGRTAGRAVDLLDGLPLVGGAEETGREEDHADEGHADEGHAEEGHAEEGHGEEGHAGEGHAQEGHDHAAGELDPHVWLDLELMGQLVDRVRDVLSEADPEASAAFAERAAAYRAELEALDSKFEAALDDCERTTVITSHAAFGYLTRRYGLTEEAVAGLSPEIEPDPRRLGELADLVKRTGTTTIFSERLVSPRVAETLARETGARTAVLDPLEGLTEEKTAAGATFLSVMEENLQALVEGLGCSR